MAHRDEIVAFANELLDVASYPDYGPMGMQVVGAADVSRIACAVSSSRDLFERAAALDAQMVLVHHGLLWDREPRAIGPVMKGRLKALFDADLSLVAYHFALDAHPEIGNNALLAGELGVDVDQRFAGIGVGGRLAEPVPVTELANRINARLDRAPLVFPYGPERIARIAVCSGGAARYLLEAAAAGYDCYITGEADEPTKRIAMETRMHFVAAGHHATETSGVQALAGRIGDRFGIAWEYVDLPNPV
jgi:dinuclear metal center YbgI/SA1388 family protein